MMSWYACVCMSAVLAITHGTVRNFFIGVVELDWNYAPTGSNQIDGRDPSKYIANSANRIGSIYMKAAYRRFTDGTYSTQMPHDPYLGYIGPLIRAEVGDVVNVTFKNFIPEFSNTIHPHGMFYLKDSEGAFYEDGTTGSEKFGDVASSSDAAYSVLWNVTENMAPGSGDPNCIPYVYHSHLNTPADVNAGLVGVISVCRKGILDVNGERMDVDKEMTVVLSIVDENQSHLMDANIRKCGNPSECQSLFDSGDEDFIESNKMHAINGYVYGNMPRPQLCEGSRVALHVIGMGTEIDIHSLMVHGQNLVSESHSTSSVSVYPAIFVAASFEPVTSGRWTMECSVAEHMEGGMQAQIDVNKCPGFVARGNAGGKIRKFCIGVELGDWDYSDGSPSKPTPGRIGNVYEKARYVGYECEGTSRATRFGAKLPNIDNFGILGSVIYGEAGDQITVFLKNNVSKPASGYSMHPEGVTHGVLGATLPGQTGTYTFTIPHDALTADDEDCVVRPYFSDVDTPRDTASGLIGPLVLCKKGTLNIAHHRMSTFGIDRLFVLLFSTFDENKSWYLSDNIARFSPGADPTDEEFIESNKIAGINGKRNMGLQGLDMCVNDNVAWHLMGWGSQTDIHTATFFGNTFISKGRRGDTELLIPGKTSTASMQPDNEGRWLLTCHTAEFTLSGMQALYNVNDCGKRNTNHINLPPPMAAPTRVRNYFIAIEEIAWEYAQRKTSPINGDDLLDPNVEGNIFLRDSSQFIGSEYLKARFVDYTDNTFRKKIIRSNRNVHLGLNGPIISANVGDTIQIMLKNDASIPYSIHPHGAFYDKANEGSLYDDGTTTSGREPVLPGKIKAYTWTVPERSGPGPNDPNCIPWLYMSAMDQVKDPFSGLFGPLIICRRGILNDAGRRADVDREFVLTFAVLDENQSNYLETNIDQRAVDRKNPNQRDDDFEESNLMHSINGFLFANNQGLEMIDGETIAWYMLSFGGEVDIHTVHFHGQTHIRDKINQKRNDVTTIFPGGNAVVEMKLDNPGTWLLHCHVHDHISAGMETVYTVFKKASTIRPRQDKKSPKNKSDERDDD